MLDDPSGDSWTLSRFAARITEQVYLMDSLNPSTGEPNPMGSYLLHLGLLVLEPDDEAPRGRVFTDYAAARAFVDWLDEPSERVVKLVKPE